MEGFNLAVPAYKEETEENNYGDGEKYCTVENMLMRSKSTNQLKMQTFKFTSNQVW